MAIFYEFIRTPIFSRLLDGTGEQKPLLEEIEAEIAKDPINKGIGIKGGIHKVRIASTKRSEGKRGGYRVWFYFDKPDDIYLIFLLDKREAADLTPRQEMQLDIELSQALGRKR